MEPPNFCFDACLYRLSAKNSAKTAFKRPEHISLVVIESRPPTECVRNVLRQEFTLSYCKCETNKSELIEWQNGVAFVSIFIFLCARIIAKNGQKKKTGNLHSKYTSIVDILRGF